MTEAEAEARAALAAFEGLGGLECWIADQRPWQAIPTSWTVPGDLQGWRYRVEPTAQGLRLRAWAPEGGAPAVWEVAEPG